jgi:hypothetical protein
MCRWWRRRALIVAVLFCKIISFMKSNRLYDDAFRWLYEAVEFVPDRYADRFAATMQREPFAQQILTPALPPGPSGSACRHGGIPSKVLFEMFATGVANENS